jgi:hypothetical protein
MNVSTFLKKASNTYIDVVHTQSMNIAARKRNRIQDLRKGKAGRRFILNGSYLSAAAAPCSGVVAGPETADFLDFFRHITAGICGTREQGIVRASIFSLTLYLRSLVGQ